MNSQLQRTDTQVSPLRPDCRKTALAGDSHHCRILRRGDHLFRTGDPVEHAFTIIAGAFKSYMVHPDGEEQILGFHFSGDLVGLDITVDGPATCCMVALDTSNVQSLTLIGHLSPDPETTRALQAAMHREIQRLNRLLHLDRTSAESRVAAFLLDYAESQALRGYSCQRLSLPMRRRELAQYLGLAIETLSRVLGRFRDRGVLRVSGQQIVLQNIAALVTAAGRQGTAPGG